MVEPKPNRPNYAEFTHVRYLSDWIQDLYPELGYKEHRHAVNLVTNVIRKERPAMAVHLAKYPMAVNRYGHFFVDRYVQVKHRYWKIFTCYKTIYIRIYND